MEGARVPMYLKQRHDAEKQAQEIVAALDTGDRFHVDRVKNEEQDHQERKSSIERRKEPCEQDIDQYAAEREQQHVDEMTNVGVESEDLCLHHEGEQRERAIVGVVGSVEAGKRSLGPKVRER